MRPAVAVKRVGYGSKISETNQLVWAVVDHQTKVFIQGPLGALIYPYDKAGLAKARQMVTELKAAK